MAKGLARYRLFLMLVIAAVHCTPIFAGTSEIQENKPFLASSISNTHPFVGQEVLLTYKLYFRDAAPKISYELTPSFQGLWAREAGSERFIKSIQTTIQGKQFRSAIVKQFRLVPVQSGRITISGYSMLCTLPQESVPNNGKERPDTRLRLTAPAIAISAQALPEPVPEKLSGAVGIFSIDLLADKQKLRIGESLSLKLILTGTGSLLTLELPTLKLPESFRYNPPERTTTLTKESETSSGAITSTILAWPQSEGDFQIPAATLVVFNPDTKQFSIIQSKPLSITVAPAVQSTRASSGEHIDTSTEKQSSENLFFPTVAIALLLLMSGAAIVLVRKKRLTDTTKTGIESTAEHPPESRTSAKTMQQQLFSLLEEAGIKSPGGMTRKELQTALQKIKIPDETRSELPAVLDSLDKILYSSTEEQESRIPDWVAIKVNELQDSLKKAGFSR
jgi:hypothetical protein